MLGDVNPSIWNLESSVIGSSGGDAPEERPALPGLEKERLRWIGRSHLDRSSSELLSPPVGARLPMNAAEKVDLISQRRPAKQARTARTTRGPQGLSPALELLTPLYTSTIVNSSTHIKARNTHAPVAKASTTITPSQKRTPIAPSCRPSIPAHYFFPPP